MVVITAVLHCHAAGCPSPHACWSRMSSLSLSPSFLSAGSLVSHWFCSIGYQGGGDGRHFRPPALSYGTIDIDMLGWWVVVVCKMVVVTVVVQWCYGCCERTYQQVGAMRMCCDCNMDIPSITSNQTAENMLVNVRMH